MDKNKRSGASALTNKPAGAEVVAKKRFDPPPLWALILVLVSLAACKPVFETDRDVQARQALFDLMEIQESFRGENQRYARNLVEIGKYNLKYHTGIVYMEIEKASKDGYRAISLPAESTTARVFSYDSDKGGFYEMGDDEISNYVLGSLNHIRKINTNLKVIDFLSSALAVFLLGLGVATVIRHKGKGRAVLLPYFLCLIPLFWAMMTQNHMNDEIVVPPHLLGVWYGSFALAVICIAWNLAILGKTLDPKNPPIFLNLLICTLLISFCSGLLLLNTYIKYGLWAPI